MIMPTTTTPMKPTTSTRTRGDGIDPHFWLDPLRLADVGDAIAAELSALAPDEAATFTQNAAALRSELEALDAEFSAALADCANTDLVTSHQAFGYLAQRYGLTQVGISGLSPDEEPTPAQLAEVTDFVAANDVTTIYYETLVDPGIAETVAAETGASTAVLDPLEGLNADSRHRGRWRRLLLGHAHQPGHAASPVRAARERPRVECDQW